MGITSSSTFSGFQCLRLLGNFSSQGRAPTGTGDPQSEKDPGPMRDPSPFTPGSKYPLASEGLPSRPGPAGSPPSPAFALLLPINCSSMASCCSTVTQANGLKEGSNRGSLKRIFLQMLNPPGFQNPVPAPTHGDRPLPGAARPLGCQDEQGARVRLVSDQRARPGSPGRLRNLGHSCTRVSRAGDGQGLSPRGVGRRLMHT